jgi:hypothetical protein
LLKGKGRAGWDATKDNLLLTLKQLDVAAQVKNIVVLRLAALSFWCADNSMQDSIWPASRQLSGCAVVLCSCTTVAWWCSNLLQLLLSVLGLLWQRCVTSKSALDLLCMQVSAAEGLRTAVQQHALPAADAAACLLPLAITNVRLKDKLEEVRSLMPQISHTGHTHVCSLNPAAMLNAAVSTR